MTVLLTKLPGQDHVALLGDACHPTLPYPAQGAAMAVEDGAVLGVLLGCLNRSGLQKPASYIPEMLRLYEALQKSRTTLNVKGAIANQNMYHLPEGPERRARDDELATVDWKKSSSFLWADIRYQKSLLAFDCMAAAEEAFAGWMKEVDKGHFAPVL
jgi:salicylate hydroxylase